MTDKTEAILQFLNSANPTRSCKNNSKVLERSLLGTLPEKPQIPPRPEVIKFFAKRKCYPRGWRKILGVGDEFHPELGGIGDKPLYIVDFPTGCPL